MEEIQHDYRDRLEANAREAARIKGRIRLIGLLRLVVFVGAVAGIYLLRDAGAWAWGSVALAGIAVFLGLARVHDRWFRRKEFADCRERVIRRELALLEYRFEGIDGGDEFIDPTHDYSFDLDLFGSKSLFAYLNRSATAAGRRALAQAMRHPRLDGDAIRRQQEAVEELSSRTDLLVDFQAWGASSGECVDDARLLELNFGNWEMQPFLSNPDPRLAEWYADYLHVPATGGESFVQQYHRVAAFLDELRTLPYSHVVVFAHGGVLVCAQIYAGLTRPEEAFSVLPPYGGMVHISL